MSEDDVTYFAYGTLLELAGMRKFCPGARRTHLATLVDYEFLFEEYAQEPSRGGCNLRFAKGANTLGVLYLVSSIEIEDLDVASGVDTGSYCRRRVRVAVDDQPIDADTYVIPRPLGLFQPVEDYKSQVYRGALEVGLPEEYVRDCLAPLVL